MTSEGGREGGVTEQQEAREGEWECDRQSEFIAISVSRSFNVHAIAETKTRQSLV